MLFRSGQVHSHTTILAEYPMAHIVGETVPYYPIPTEENRELYKCYEKEANGLAEKVLFIGRLADYMYYNMDQAVARALTISRKI